MEKGCWMMWKLLLISCHFLSHLLRLKENSEEAIKMVSEKLSFNYSQALFCAVDTLYSMKYEISEEFVDKVPLIIFNNNNPFIK